MTMSCNGCKILRKGCSETCSLRHCLTCIDSPEAQQRATLFVTKFFGRAGFAAFINGVSESQRPALFQSLLYEACGRTVNPIYGAVGLLFTGNWAVCQAAVEKVLRGGTLEPVNINHDHHHSRTGPIASHDNFFCNTGGHESGSSSSCIDSELINLAGAARRRTVSSEMVGKHESKHHQLAVANNCTSMASPCELEGSRRSSVKRLHTWEYGCIQTEESEVKLRLPELRIDRNRTCCRSDSRERDRSDHETKEWEGLDPAHGRRIGGGDVDLAAIGNPKKAARIRRSTAAAAAPWRNAANASSTAVAPPPPPPAISAAAAKNNNDRHRDSLFSTSTSTRFPLAHNGRRLITTENGRRLPPECPPTPPPFQTNVSRSDATITAMHNPSGHVMDTSALDVNQPPFHPDHCFSSSCSPSANSAGSVTVFTLPDHTDHRSPRPQPKLLDLLP